MPGIPQIELGVLTPRAQDAFVRALLNLPNDATNPAPLCERIGMILDVLIPLSRNPDFTPGDRALLSLWVQSDGSIATCVAISDALDLARRMMKTK